MFLSHFFPLWRRKNRRGRREGGTERSPVITDTTTTFPLLRQAQFQKQTDSSSAADSKGPIVNHSSMMAAVDIFSDRCPLCFHLRFVFPPSRLRRPPPRLPPPSLTWLLASVRVPAVVSFRICSVLLWGRESEASAPGPLHSHSLFFSFFTFFFFVAAYGKQSSSMHHVHVTLLVCSLGLLDELVN